MRTYLLILLCCYTMDIFGQYWEELPKIEENRQNGDRRIVPDKYKAFTFDVQALQNILKLAPHERAVKVSASEALLSVPMSDGTILTFQIVEYSMVESGLASKYPNLKTYRGRGIKNPTNRIRLDWTERGFRAMIVTQKGAAFIDPLYRGNTEFYQSYFKRDYTTNSEFKCLVTEQNDFKANEGSNGNRQSGDCVFRSYRLAVATTGEYSNHFDVFSSTGEGTILSEVMTTINRVNEVYEADVAIRLILIDSTINVFYYDGSNDPYTNNSGGTMLGQNQTTCDNVIGSANYDIGHVFSTGGGGVATLRSPCSGGKARGVTGQSIPENDPFSIDFVAHEMGHQFGGNHTQNNSCNRASTASMEPGSASTIMGYAGICSPNVQSNSDAYFHGRSIEEINAFISFNGDGDACDTPLPFGNNAPIMNTNGSDYTIPISTPFVLTADASDPDSDPMTYCWEQWDTEVGEQMPPVSTNTQGPMFRSFFATPSPSRYFPRLLDLVNNTPFDWEELPSVTRDMEFRVTVRDYHNVAGCTTEDNVNVMTTSSAGPFVVTSPAANVTWVESQNVTIEWDVANTTAAPVNCANVDIFLSYDGGFTYPEQIASQTPNDGTQSVVVPLGLTTTGRIMVKAANNIFFDISDDHITINSGGPNYAFNSLDTNKEICDESILTFDVDVESINDYLGPVNLSLIGTPAGATASFSSNPVIPGTPFTLTLNNLTNTPVGSYSMTINGTSAVGNKSIDLLLLKKESPEAILLSSPSDASEEISTIALFGWANSLLSDQYQFQLSDDPGFGSFVTNLTQTETSYQLSTPLDISTTYYWRVQGSNDCGNGEWSDVFSFETRSCQILSSADVPIDISSSGTPTINSIVNADIFGEITDVNISFDISHTYTSDLDISIIAPNGETILLINDQCGSNNNMSLIFDDQASSNIIPCPPTTGLAYQPVGNLSLFNSDEVNGVWTLEVKDDANADGGTLNNWALEVCYLPATCQLNVDTKIANILGSLAAAVACAKNGDTIRFEANLNGDTIDLSEPLIINKNLVLLNTNPNLVTIHAASNTYAFEIGIGGSVEMHNLSIVGHASTIGSAIVNNGTLKLIDTHVTDGGGTASRTSILNTSSLTLEGNCEVND